MRFPILLIVLFVAHTSLFAQTSGRVVSDRNQAVFNALVSNIRTNQHNHSDQAGRFVLDACRIGDSIRIESFGFETYSFQLTDNQILEGITAVLLEKLFDLKEVVIEQKVSGQNAISEIDTRINPVNSSQEILRKVPGLFIAQHAGGGKAEQLFLRGFDIDHGTDIAIDVDGLPVNMVSHAHGQGYADLHFLIPETVDKIDFGKGPYYADQGNFNTAGYVSFRTKDVLDKNSITAQIGQFNTARLVAMTNLLPKNDQQSAFIATEFQMTDGPFEAPQNFNRLNLMGKYVFTAKNFDQFEFMVSHFRSAWDASGQVPQRAVDAGLINRFGAIDATEGGQTSRSNFSIQHSHAVSPNMYIKNQVYWVDYGFELFSNFTFFLDDSINGDQIRQAEKRQILGIRSDLDYQIRPNLLWKSGIALRNDATDGSTLAHTKNRRTTLENYKQGNVMETNISGHSQVEWRHGDWLINPGLRLDAFKFGYQDQLDSVYSNKTKTATVASPKLNFFYAPQSNIQYFFKTGIGYHANDSRAVVETDVVRQALPRAFGADLGFIWKPAKRLIANAALWTLFLEQEFVYVGDAGIVEPSGKTRRMGADFGLRFQALDWLFADVDATYSQARSLEAEQGQDRIPLAPRFTLVGGLSAQTRTGLTAALRVRHLQDRPANEGNTIVALGYTVFDANVAYTLGIWNVGVQVENLLNTQWNEAQFATESRLRNETAPLAELHFTPGVPFLARIKLGVSF